MSRDPDLPSLAVTCLSTTYKSLKMVELNYSWFYAQVPLYFCFVPCFCFNAAHLQSDAGGSIPRWIQNMAMTGQVFGDGRIFLNYLLKELQVEENKENKEVPSSTSQHGT